MAFLVTNLSSPSPVLLPATATARQQNAQTPPTAYTSAPKLRATPPASPNLRKLENRSIMSTGGGGDGRGEFYLNLGLAVRTLREDLPVLFSRELNYDIYRDDITFMDPLNTFQGIENYRLIFWALRFHGRILFREINLEILRIWQPSDNAILVRWNLRGVPRVPWEAQGQFQGTSRYRLDRNGKIYEHNVDNLAFNFPRMAVKPETILDLAVSPVPCLATPNLTFLNWSVEGMFSCSWVDLYRAVRETLDGEANVVAAIELDGILATCL